MMKRMMILMGCAAMTMAGCSNQQNSTMTTVKEILELAKSDKVSGSMKVHLNGDMEAGMREGFYFGSPGSVMDAELLFRMENVEMPEAIRKSQAAGTKPAVVTTQPAKTK